MTDLGQTTLLPLDGDLGTYDGAQPLVGRREAFARGLFEGLDVREAYLAAGFTRPRSNANNLARDPAVQARVAHLRRDLDAKDLALRSVRRRQLREQLTAITGVDRVEMFEEVTVTKRVGRGENAREVEMRSLRIKPLAELTPEQRALFEGIESDGRPVMPGKLQAAMLLAKLDGLDQPARHEHAASMSLEGLILRMGDEQ